MVCMENNGGVGIMTGSYDQNLSILSVNNLLLHSTGYSAADVAAMTSCRRSTPTISIT